MTEEKQITRTPYMERIMSETYSQCTLNAVINGTIEGAWEQAIAERLISDSMCYTDGLVRMTNATKVADHLGLFEGQETDWRKVAEAILKTKPKEDELPPIR